MKLVNLCPHQVSVKHSDGTETTILQSGVARVAVSYQDAGNVILGDHTVRVIKGIYGAVTGLPDPEKDCYFIVSHMVRMALPQRGDLLSPADLVRDAQGNILACRMFESNIVG
jgi:hypothetical protein